MPGKPEDFAWAAGCLECDGHIGIVRYAANPLRREITPRYVANVHIGGTLHAIPNRFLEIFEFGTVCPVRKPVENRRPVVQYQARNALAEKLIRAVQPYLVAKRRQAEIVLALRDIQVFGGVRVPDEVLVQREALYREIRGLSMKGAR